MTLSPGRRLALTAGAALALAAAAGTSAPARAAGARDAAPVGAGPRADVVGDARAAASALRIRVAALQLQAEQATEAYDAAYAELAAAVTAHLSAQRDLATAQAAAGSTDDQAGARVRALYMSGGTVGLYASVLSSGDLTEALSRLHQVGAVLDGDTRAARRAGSALAGQRRAEERLAAAAGVSVRLQRTVADRGDTVRALLSRTDALLAAADTRVRLLAEQQQRAAEAAAAAAAAATLARLEAAAVLAPTAATALAGLPPAGPAAATAIAFARAQLGKPYVWGATGPDSYDCSGLTGAAYAAAGVSLPRTARQQWYAGPHVALTDLQPGDLLFWASNLADPASIHHVALYLGGGQMLAAPHTGAVVRIQPLYLDGYLGAVRPPAGHP